VLPLAVIVSVQGMKCAILVKQSTITEIESLPEEGGSFTMKSREIKSQGMLLIGIGINRP
jgi:hypothetical protein